MNNFKPYKRKVNYYETDKMSIVHHSNYIRFLEEARIDMLAQAGYPFDKMESEGVWIPVLSAYCEYKFPLCFGDEFEIHPKVTKFNGCKLELSYEIFNVTKGGKLSAVGKTTHCLTDVNMKPLRSQKSHPDIYKVFADALVEE